MGDDMFSKISDILDNPDALDKIKSIAAELGGGNVGGSNMSPPPSAPDAQALQSSPSEISSDAVSLLSGLNINFDGARTIALLEAIRPFMRESRAAKVNTAIKAVQMMGVLSKLR